MNNNGKDLSRPSVEVKIPQVKLTLSDLAYLRSVAQPDAVSCHLPRRALDKLRFLDLIHLAKVPPSQEKVDKVHQEQSKLSDKIAKALADRDWEGVNHMAYELKTLERSLEPAQKNVLTRKGEELLRMGEVKVRARKVGCV